MAFSSSSYPLIRNINGPTGLTGWLRRFLHTETAYTAGGNILLLLGGLTTGILSARVLGPQGRGEFLTVYTWAGVLGIVLTGAVFHALVTYAKRGLCSRQIQRFIWRHLALTTASAGILGWATLMSGSVHWLRGTAVLGGLLFTVSTVASADLAGVTIGYGDLRRGLQLVRLMPIATGIGAASFLAVSSNQSADVWLLLIGIAQLGPSLAWLALLGPNPSIPEAGVERVRLSQIARTAGRFYAAGIAAQINYRLDLLVVSIVLARTAVADYGVAVAAGTAVASVGQAAGLVSFGRFASRAAGANAVVAVRVGAIKAAAFSAALAVPVALAAPFLVGRLYGHQYHPAIAPTIVLVLSAVPLSAEFLLIHAFIGLRQRLSRLYITLGTTSALTVIGVGWITTTTHNLLLVALVSPVVYTCSALLLLTFSRGFRSNEP